MKVEPFEIAIPDDVLADLRERIARTRWPDEIDGDVESDRNDAIGDLAVLPATWLKRNGKSPCETDAKLLSLHGCDGTLFVRQLKQVWALLVDLNDKIAEPDQHQPGNARGHLRHDTGTRLT